MAFSRLSLLCFIVVFLGLATVISCNEIENRRNAEGVRDSRNPYIYKRDEHEKRLATDRGEVLAVPIFRESSILEKDLVNYELNCLYIRPNSFMLPHYSSALRILFVQQGRARVGWVRGGKLREEDLERGSVVLIPMGSVFYAINKDQVENLVIVNLLHNPNPYTNRHHESFYIGGGRNPPTILSAFRRETLAAAFNTAGRNIESLLSKQDEGAFASLRKEQMRKLIVSSDHEIQSIPFWNRAPKTIEEEYKPFNLLKKKPRFSNNYGQYISAEDEDLVKSLLDREEVGIRYTKIEPRAMSVPNWESHATRISVVVSGRGRVEIASPEGTQQQRRGEGEGEGQKQEETEEGRGGEFTVSYKRVEDDVQEGDVVVVPAGHPLVQISSSNQRLEILTFLINDDERNTMNFLAGKNSVTRAVKDEILAASFKASEQEVKKTLESQEEQIFVKGPSERESENESGGSRAIL